MISLALALALTSAAPRAPLWHKPELPHAKPEHAPQRIVSLAPVVTETLFALFAGRSVVGDTRFCDRPPAATKLPHVGGYVDISLERVLELKPDLVVAMPSMGQRDVLDRLRERGIPVLVVFGDTLDEVEASIRTLGDVVDTHDSKAAASTLAAILHGAEDQLRKQGARSAQHRKAAIVVGTDPLVLAGPGTFAFDALTFAGYESPFPDRAPMWPTWSLESLASAHVDVLVAAEGGDARAKLEVLVARAIPDANRRPRVVSADEAILMRPGPSLAGDLDTLAAMLERASQSSDEYAKTVKDRAIGDFPIESTKP